MTVKAFRDIGKSSELDDVDKVTEDMIAQAPAIFVAPTTGEEERDEMRYTRLC